MSEKDTNNKKMTLEKMEKYKEQRRCPTCKKRCFGDMVMCTMCEKYSIGRQVFISSLQDSPGDNVALHVNLYLPPPRFSMRLKDLPSAFTYMLFRRGVSILLEIVDAYCYYSRHGVIARDRAGVVTHIIFMDPTNTYYHKNFDSRCLEPIPLTKCLQPGNFILVLDCHWHPFPGGKLAIQVYDLKTVHFVLD